MNQQEVTHLDRLKQALASYLDYGTRLAAVIILIGMVLVFLQESTLPTLGLRIITLGVGLIIAMPVLRVALMLIAFLRQGDYLYGAIALIVLLMIAIGTLIGRSLPTQH